MMWSIFVRITKTWSPISSMRSDISFASPSSVCIISLNSATDSDTTPATFVIVSDFSIMEPDSCFIVLMETLISLVAFCVRSASFLTSSATTAKPRPCSPARAASIAALRARRLVWSAISLMRSTTDVISLLIAFRRSMELLESLICITSD